MTSIPLVDNNGRESINTSVIAIKKEIEQINSLLQNLNNKLKSLSDNDFLFRSDLTDTVTVGDNQPVTSNGVAGAITEAETNIKKDIKTFTYIIDSNTKLQNWINGVSGNDYTSVLIKKGTYYYNKNTSINNPTMTSTKYVEGEAGSMIYISCNTASNNLGYVFYSASNWHNVNCTVNINGIYTRNGTSSIFYNCKNFYNCTFTINISGTFDVNYGTVSIFYNCSYFDDCDFSFSDTGRTGSSYGGSYYFYNCNRLSNCYIHGSITSQSGSRSVFFNCNSLTSLQVSFYCSASGGGTPVLIGSCKKVLHCTSGGSGTFTAYSGSYASSTTTSTYACADTANGGWNS